jgi:hypothetical protein
MSTRTEFTVHSLNERGIANMDDLADILSESLTRIETLVPPGRERALIVTKLQEVACFAHRGIALDPLNQKTA